MKKLRIILFFLIPGFAGIAQTSPYLKTSITNYGDDSSAIFTFVEKMPEFIGDGGFQHYLVLNIKYPALEKEAGKEGTVYVKFVIEKDGAVTNVRVAKEVRDAPGLTEEAIRVIKGMPNWKPGMMNGKEVRTEVTQPVKFVIPGYNVTPSFPGGDTALTNYIKQNLVYPAKEKKNGTQGSVTLKFFVETDGSITNIEVAFANPNTPRFTEEAKRLVSTMPK